MVSNRVPAADSGSRGTEGGLAIAIRDALEENGGIWFGWSGKITQTPPDGPEVVEVGKITYATVDLSEQDYNEYYSGYANSVLWPLFHYRLDLTDFSRRDMAGYMNVNAAFADQLLPLLHEDDIVWVHDYHFIPLCGYLRRAGCRNKIGFFLHIPWPPEELLLTLPNHQSLVREMCSYDLIGFQTERDLSAFLGYVRKETNGRVRPNGVVNALGHKTLTGVFPISIDTAKVSETAEMVESKSRKPAPQDGAPQAKTIIGVDRLDYTKGLLERLEAFRHFLNTYKEYHRNVVFVQIAPPSRTDLHSYQLISQQVESAVGHINGSFADFDWSPVRYLNRGVSREKLMGFLRLSKVGLVTPLRDGMNLVAKEYVAAQSPEDPGVLVLSRFAGAAQELSGALLVNPYDIEGVSDALARALAMSKDERRERWQGMYQRLKQFDIVAWRESYLQALHGAEHAA
ncbi:MAG: alpha,alpha-trehalose-phosphate synthase (UDP-forming) [Kiloniellales bacterium]|nr:alpha,alpha-trehalose-phosphate synthase (UDP-forming) [Kiloniellales bacterium]